MGEAYTVDLLPIKVANIKSNILNLTRPASIYFRDNNIKSYIAEKHFFPFHTFAPLQRRKVSTVIVVMFRSLSLMMKTFNFKDKM